MNRFDLLGLGVALTVYFMTNFWWSLIPLFAALVISGIGEAIYYGDSHPAFHRDDQ